MGLKIDSSYSNIIMPIHETEITPTLRSAAD